MLRQANNERPGRPMSAKPSAAAQSAATLSLFASTRSLLQARQGNGATQPQSSAQADEDEDEDEDDGVLDDDDDDDEDQDEFGDAAERQTKPTAANPSTHFRPASAPPARSKPALASARENGLQQQQQQQQHDPKAAAAMSISYLKAAAEKKKARDREFADQANKILLHAGSKKSFALAPDREGVHMIRILDPPANGRVVCVEIFYIFLFVFCPHVAFFGRILGDKRVAKLLNHLVRLLHCVSLKNWQRCRSAKRVQAARREGDRRLLLFPEATPKAAQTPREQPSTPYHQFQDSDPFDRAPSSTKRAMMAAGSKAPDRSQIQDELKSVLASTIELAKVLQDQLHELNLKDWSFAPRGTAPEAQ